MDDFASSALVELISTELTKQGFAAPAHRLFEGRTERASKASILSEALERLGPIAILRIGQGARRPPFHPIVDVLADAVSPADLIDRWQRMEVYYHGRHRVRLLELGERHATLEHYAVSGPAPSPGEDLVVAGLLAALLQLAGARMLAMTFDGVTVMDRDNFVSDARSATQTRQWCLGWSGFVTGKQGSAVPPDGLSVSQRARLILADDLGRRWRLKTLAEALSISGRTLQRQLAATSTTFSQLLREVRAEAAAKAVLEGDLSLADIGYAVGYSDQAHFSREFRLRYNLPPSEYQALGHRRGDPI